jgi:hypothetical protein
MCNEDEMEIGNNNNNWYLSINSKHLVIDSQPAK